MSCNTDKCAKLDIAILPVPKNVYRGKLLLGSKIFTPVECCGTNVSDYYPRQPVIEGTRYPLPDGPDLGVEFNEELSFSQDFKLYEAPRLRRSDGLLRIGRQLMG